mmetsp:Transcript_35773/g.40781  ORF Transcript_35773/g.40781 Transcript_35773/m.40781 type:complete len:203 (-) Transcript_35773:2878-3486(-)
MLCARLLYVSSLSFLWSWSRSRTAASSFSIHIIFNILLTVRTPGSPIITHGLSFHIFPIHTLFFQFFISIAIFIALVLIGIKVFLFAFGSSFSIIIIFFSSHRTWITVTRIILILVNIFVVFVTIHAQKVPTGLLGGNFIFFCVHIESFILRNRLNNLLPIKIHWTSCIRYFHVSQPILDGIPITVINHINPLDRLGEIFSN